MLIRDRFLVMLLPLIIVSLGAASCGSSVKGPGGAGAGSTGAGAGSTGAGAGGTGAGAGGASGGCPASTPSNASACPGVPAGTACDYPTPCCEDTVATCNGGQWDVQEGACAGMAAKIPKSPCPQQPPAEGSSCSVDCADAPTCIYGACPGSMGPAIVATCEGTWVITVQCDGGLGGGGGGGG